MKGLERIAKERRHLIAAQVRCSTGFTWGWQKAEGGLASVPLLRPRQAPANASAATDAGAAARVARLARLLRTWPEGEMLPSPATLAEMARMAPDHEPHIAGHRLARAFAALEAAGVLRTVAGSREAHQGQRLVLMLETGRMLRTERAPLEWLKRVRGGA